MSKPFIPKFGPHTTQINEAKHFSNRTHHQQDQTTTQCWEQTTFRYARNQTKKQREKKQNTLTKELDGQTILFFFLVRHKEESAQPSGSSFFPPYLSFSCVGTPSQRKKRRSVFAVRIPSYTPDPAHGHILRPKMR